MVCILQVSALSMLLRSQYLRQNPSLVAQCRAPVLMLQQLCMHLVSFKLHVCFSTTYKSSEWVTAYLFLLFISFLCRNETCSLPGSGDSQLYLGHSVHLFLHILFACGVFLLLCIVSMAVKAASEAMSAFSSGSKPENAAEDIWEAVRSDRKLTSRPASLSVRSLFGQYYTGVQCHLDIHGWLFVHFPVHPVTSERGCLLFVVGMVLLCHASPPLLSNQEYPNFGSENVHVHPWLVRGLL